ncbi:MAG: AEC family transporter [Oscillospiraceae bacterium]
MNNILFLINAIFPLFVLVILGNMIKTKGLINDDTIKQVNAICFKILIPCSLFKTIIKSNTSDGFDIRVVIFLIFSYIITAALLSFVVPKFVKSKGSAGSLIHGSFRSNVVLLGIPLAQNILGDAGGAQMAVSIAIVVPLFNVLGVIVLSTFSENENHKPDFKHIAIDIIKNPLIIATFFGFFVSILKFPLPRIIMQPIVDLGACGTPLAMLMLGAGFSFKSAIGNRNLNIAGVLIKLVIMPFVMTTVAYFMGIRGIGLAVIYLTHASPSAATAGMLAENMGCDGKLAGEITLITTGLASVTIFAGSLILMNLGVF